MGSFEIGLVVIVGLLAICVAVELVRTPPAFDYLRIVYEKASEAECRHEWALGEKRRVEGRAGKHAAEIQFVTCVHCEVERRAEDVIDLWNFEEFVKDSLRWRAKSDE